MVRLKYTLSVIILFFGTPMRNGTEYSWIPRLNWAFICIT